MLSAENFTQHVKRQVTHQQRILLVQGQFVVVRD